MTEQKIIAARDDPNPYFLTDPERSNVLGVKTRMVIHAYELLLKRREWLDGESLVEVLARLNAHRKSQSQNRGRLLTSDEPTLHSLDLFGVPGAMVIVLMGMMRTPASRVLKVLQLDDLDNNPKVKVIFTRDLPYGGSVTRIEIPRRADPKAFPQGVEILQNELVNPHRDLLITIRNEEPCYEDGIVDVELTIFDLL